MNTEMLLRVLWTVWLVLICTVEVTWGVTCHSYCQKDGYGGYEKWRPSETCNDKYCCGDVWDSKIELKYCCNRRANKIEEQYNTGPKTKDQCNEKTEMNITVVIVIVVVVSLVIFILPLALICYCRYRRARSARQSAGPMIYSAAGPQPPQVYIPPSGGGQQAYPSYQPPAQTTISTSVYPPNQQYYPQYNHPQQGVDTGAPPPAYDSVVVPK